MSDEEIIIEENEFLGEEEEKDPVISSSLGFNEIEDTSSVVVDTVPNDGSMNMTDRDPLIPKISMSETSISQEGEDEKFEDSKKSGERNKTRVCIEKNVVWLIFLIQGCACLVPYFCYVNCPDYFLRLYFPQVMSVIPSVYILPNILGLLLMTVLGSRTPFFCRLCSFIGVPYIFFILSLAAVPAIDWMGMNRWVEFGITMVLVFGCGLFTAVLQGEIFGSSFYFKGGEMIQGVMTGNGFIGIVIAVLRIVTKVTVERKGTYMEYKISATIYFCIGSFAMFCFLIVYLFFYVIPYSRIVLCSGRGKKKGDKKPIGKSQALISGYEGGESTEEDQKFLSESIPFHKKAWDEIVDWGWAFLVNWKNCYYVCAILTVSYCVFPGICVLIPTAFPTTFMGDWFQVIMTTQFTFFDFFGRTILRWYLGGQKYFWIIVPVRIVLVVLIILCMHPVWWLHHDLIPFALVAVLAITNGYYSTAVMIFSDIQATGRAKKRAKEKNLFGDAEEEYVSKCVKTIGTITTFWMICGIGFGVWSSLALYYIIKAIYGD